MSLKDRPALTGGRFRTCLLAVFLPGWTVWWGGWCTLAGWLKSPALCRFGLRIWSRAILMIAGVRVDFRTPKSFSDAPCVFIVNHQSALDIPILLSVLMRTHDVRFMAKESLFKIPFLGWGMAGNGFIPIRRESARHAADTFMQITSKNGANFSYIVFPEGTRSEDGHLQELKRGAIALVMRLKKPLVPISLIDACRANPKGRLLVRSGTVRVVVHDPILPDEIAIENDERTYRESLLKQITAAVASELSEDQKPCPVPSPSK